MPLRARVDDQDLLAPFLTDAEWDALAIAVKSHTRQVILPCCGSAAYLRVSKLGIRHFVHQRRGDCSSAPETWQHLKTKHDIALACRQSGYQVQTEAVGDGWRADVLASKGSVKIAFEIQWSAQTWEVTQERQQRYKEAGIRGCWFIRTPPYGYELTGEIPLFKIEVSEESTEILFHPRGCKPECEDGCRHIPLSGFVATLLAGKIRFCDHLQSRHRQKLRFVFEEIKCWRCSRPYHIYYLDDLVTGCGETVDVSHEEDKYSFAPEIVALVEEYAHSPKGSVSRTPNWRAEK